MKEALRGWRNSRQQLRLEGEICRSQKCHDKKIFPPRDICPDCGQEAKEPYQFSGRGTVYSVTKVIDAPSGHEHNAPYPMALVKLEEGPTLTSQLTDLGNQIPEINMPVEMVTRKLSSDGDKGVINYGYKFRPPIR